MSFSALIASLLALASTIYGARRFSRILVIELALGPFAAGALTAAIAAGVFLTSLAFVGRRVHSFDAGLWAAAAAGILLAAIAFRIKAPKERDLPRADRSVEIGVLVASALMLLLYTHLALTYQMHDEHSLFGHKSMVEQLRRGVYPIYFPPMPEHEARYHYGFDILAGVLARALGLSSDASIDLITILCVLFMCWTAAAVAVDAGAAKSAPLAVLAIHLGAGLASILLAGDPAMHPRCLTQFHHPTCHMDLYPTQIMNVFQHPVSLGLPMFLATVILLPRVAGCIRVADEARVWKRRAWWIASLLAIPVLSGLALSQLVYFGLGTLAAVAAVPIWLLGKRMPYVLGPIALAIVLGLGLLLAQSLGGMMAHHPAVDTTLLARRPVIGFPANTPFDGILIAHVANLGIGFVLLPVFAGVVLWERRPPVAMLLAFACGGILAAQLYNYARSWDIVKFPSASSFALSLLYVVVIDRMLAGRPFPWVWLRRAGAGLLLATGITAATFVAIPLEGAGMKLYDDTKHGPDPLVKQTIDWWLQRGYESEELIYAQKNIATQLAIYGGLSTVGSDTDFYYLGIRMNELHRLESLARRIKLAMDQRALDELRVEWVMLSDEEVQNLGPHAQRELDVPERFELMHTVDDPRPGKRRRIWRVKRTPKSSDAATSAIPGAK